MTHILCLETATEICSVALSADNECIVCKEDTDGHSHAEKIMELTDSCLKEAGLRPQDLDAVCISGGPGSYTGLRIGTSTAKGLAYALHLPLLSVPSLEGIACGARQARPEGEVYCPMIDARRMEVYCALYDADGRLLRDCSNQIIETTSFAEILDKKRMVFCGNGAPKCKELLVHPNALFSGTLSSARFLIPSAFRRFQQQQFEDVAYFEPFYLKEFVAGKPHVKGLDV